jgi:tetrahydromethanopterin S-methyltransferase subunit C
VDGKEIPFTSTKTSSGYDVTFTVPENGQIVTIQGTSGNTNSSTSSIFANPLILGGIIGLIASMVIAGLAFVVMKRKTITTTTNSF